MVNPPSSALPNIMHGSTPAEGIIIMPLPCEIKFHAVGTAMRWYCSVETCPSISINTGEPLG
ncbi:MAG: hypothetical protein QXM87_03650 [Candidatus Bathyarchaeia archaeon]